MTSVSLYQVSLLASFVAGMVALFAPCCISFLLPSYFGNIFRERKKVIAMTFIYSLGILTIMLPIVLGAKVLSVFFFRFHDQNYTIGGVFLLVVAVLTFLGIKFPMPHLSMKQQGKQLDVGGTYLLGVFSGVTSACCAPVLMGVMGLSAMSVSVLGAIGVGIAYVLGMVFPLYIASYFVDKGNLLEKPWLKKKVMEVTLFGRWYPIFAANLVGAAIFGVMGLLILGLAVMGRLGVPSDAFSATINQWALAVTLWGQKIPGLDVVFVVAVMGFLVILYKRR